MQFSEKPHLEIICESENEFLNFFLPWGGRNFVSKLPNNDINIRDYVYRGHSCDSFKLIPSSFRDEGIKTMIDIIHATDESYEEIKNSIEGSVLLEYLCLREFMVNCDSIGLYIPPGKHNSYLFNKTNDMQGTYRDIKEKIDIWIPSDFTEILSIAQHYGMPTRMLDWSYDPFVAVYFSSLEDKTETKDEGDFFSVWMINKKFIFNNARDPKFEEYHGVINSHTPHYSWNKNIFAQKGLFSYTPVNIKNLKKATDLLNFKKTKNSILSVDEIIIENIKHNREKEYYEKESLKKEKIRKDITNSIIEIKLNKKHKKKIRYYIDGLGYSKKTIFPSYENVIRELKLREF
ncbi:FRG domain-containing protein [Pectobacterium brasiliense]|uniref:FRG domain-containing protein n=1 Tax=Pectobacterium brasiliense TaxID=180957 RepID=UPI00196903C9|nr:FRG domain-containing protein [Pectobacterium brasiliense]MBN3265151.1 FRG domain-containing protein [Pectobacterium brasiliense]